MDARLAFDPWTRVDASQPQSPQSTSNAFERLAPRPPRAVAKSLAEGTLHLWERRNLRFNAIECSIAEDVHGIWCLLGHDHHLRVPLAMRARKMPTKNDARDALAR